MEKIMTKLTIGNNVSRRYHHEEKTRRFSSSGEDHDLARNEYWMLSGVETSLLSWIVADY
jgi:hypothetical protein